MKKSRISPAVFSGADLQHVARLMIRHGETDRDNVIHHFIGTKLTFGTIKTSKGIKGRQPPRYMSTLSAETWQLRAVPHRSPMEYSNLKLVGSFDDFIRDAIYLRMAVADDR